MHAARNCFQILRSPKQAVEYRAFAKMSLNGAKRKAPSSAANESGVPDPSPPPTKRKIQSTTSQSKVANFFTPASQKPPENCKWRTVDQSLLIAKYEPSTTPDTATLPERRRRIAAFDLDGTIISPASGKTFSKDSSDWKFWHPLVPQKLKQAHETGHQIIIFSNQGGISMKSDGKTAKSDGKRLSDYNTKVGAVLGHLDLPITLYAATERDKYRKPRTGMWQEFLEDYDLDVGEGVDITSSIFVGDAAGRIGDGGVDFSVSDRNFAQNLGLTFLTPQEYFLKEEKRPFVRSFDPSSYTSLAPVPMAFEKINAKDIVILCGSPGIGKSTFYWEKLAPLNYERVNQDLLGSRPKCLAKAHELLLDGKSVSCDNTNADESTRKHWVELGQKHGVNVRCVVLEGDPGIAMHQDALRAFGGTLVNPEKRAALPPIAFSSFAKRWSAPKLSEGFQEILTVPFTFRGTDEHRALWTRYWA